MHQRQNIRDAIVTALAGISVPVSVGRVYPDHVEALPSVNVVTADEEVAESRVMNPNVSAQWIQTRDLSFEIECRALADPPDDAIDAIALEVEQALGADETLGGEVEIIEYTGSTGELAGDLEKPAGLRTLLYTANYRVDARDPQQEED